MQKDEKASQPTNVLVPTLHLDKLVCFVKEEKIVSTSTMAYYSKFLISMHTLPFMF